MIRTGLIFTAIFFAASCALAFLGWTSLPADAQIPVHFGMNGQADRYGGKAEAFLLMPGLIAGIGLLLAVLPFIDPRGRNLRRSSRPYLVSWIGALAVMTLAQGVITWTALKGDGGVESGALTLRLVGLALALLFLALGNVLPKTRPNFFLGVRTPWTLTSDLAWEKTHRLAGRLWAATGLIGLILMLAVTPQAGLIALVVLSVGSALIAIAYSYIVWRSAPDRRQGPQPE